MQGQKRQELEVLCILLPCKKMSKGELRSPVISSQVDSFLFLNPCCIVKFSYLGDLLKNKPMNMEVEKITKVSKRKWLIILLIGVRLHEGWAVLTRFCWDSRYANESHFTYLPPR